jgi:acetate kinase
MIRAILALNAGSATLKAALFPEEGDAPLATALADRIGPDGRLSISEPGRVAAAAYGDITTHSGAVSACMAAFALRWPSLQLIAVGHRIVHGGSGFDGPVLIDEAVLETLEALSPLAPLHQPHNLAGVRAAMDAFPSVPQVACFDTAFHRPQPFVNEAFALPRSLYAEGVRRYGFHGLSYEYVWGELARLAPSLAANRVIVAHLGNGASICAIWNGRSVASTMGFSALDGLPMGTRCGQLDPGVLLYLMEHKEMKAAQISDLLYRRSGLLGISSLSNDMRTLEAAGTTEASEAIEYFVLRCRREIGAMAAALGGVDAMVFCGGIGENSARVRAGICGGLEWMGIEIDPERNDAGQLDLSARTARVAVMIIPTNEELVIARAARKLATDELPV